jgi:hypothetical protein
MSNADVRDIATITAKPGRVRRDDLVRLLGSGMEVRAIAEHLGVARQSVYSAIYRFDLKLPGAMGDKFDTMAVSSMKAATLKAVSMVHILLGDMGSEDVLRAMTPTARAATARTLSTIAGIFTDKIQLLSGKATARIDHSAVLNKFDSELAALKAARVVAIEAERLEDEDDFLAM